MQRYCKRETCACSVGNINYDFFPLNFDLLTLRSVIRYDDCYVTNLKAMEITYSDLEHLLQI